MVRLVLLAGALHSEVACEERRQGVDERWRDYPINYYTLELVYFKGEESGNCKVVKCRNYVRYAFNLHIIMFI